MPAKARVVWEDNTSQQGQVTNGDASTNSANVNQPKLNGTGSKQLIIIKNKSNVKYQCRW